MQSTVKLYSESFTQMRTYMLAALFVIGNILLPQLCHLMPNGGLVWLPIYFFTLIGAYKYGWRVGVITALVSPLINFALFGMPALAVLPAIMLKSSLLAVIAGFVAHRTGRVTLLSIAAVVVSYQAIGMLGEWAMTRDLMVALQDVRIGLPGIIAQIVLGWATLRYLLKD